RTVLIVTVKIIGSGVISDKQIQPAVVIVIAPNGAHAIGLFLVADARVARHLFESAVAIVSVKQVGLSWQSPWPTLNANAAVRARRRTAKFREVIQVNQNISGDEQVNVPIAIVVGPGRSCAKPATLYTCLLSHILEFARSDAAVKNVSLVSCCES